MSNTYVSVCVCVCELCQSSILMYAHCDACSGYFQYPNIMLIFYLAMPLNSFCQLLDEKCEIKLTASAKRKDGDTQNVKNKTFVHIVDNLLL